MEEFNYDIVQEETNPKLKQLYWNIAFGLQKVDGLTPSKYMIDLSYEHIEGKKTYKEVQKEISSYYSKCENSLNEDEKEADEVSTAIYEILNDGAFRFDYLTYKNYHKRLFKNLDKKKYNPGEFRTYNFTKDEPILNNDTVDYQSYDLIEQTLKYDFTEEKDIDYFNMNKEQLIDRVSEFTSRIWQVHPFQEGNTRTTAIFVQKYLISMGFKVNNDLFRDNSLYFRNALVRANYKNYSIGVKADKQYINAFFENLLFDKKNILDNDELKIKSSKN